MKLNGRENRNRRLPALGGLLVTLAAFGFVLAPSGFAGEADVETRAQVVPGFELLGPDPWDWLDRRDEFFARSPTPWIRTLGRLRVSGHGKAGHGSLFDRKPPRRPSKEELLERRSRLAAQIQAAPSDLYSLLVLATWCNSPDYFQVCREAHVYQRIIAMDPGNAMAYLIPISQAKQRYDGTFEERAAAVDSPEMRKLITEMSKASVWEDYAERAALQFYRANLEFVREHPPPTPKQQENPDYVLAFELGQRAPLHVLGRWDVLELLCAYYRKVNEVEMMAACGRVADVLRDSHLDLGYKLEIGTVNDPFDPEGLYLHRKWLVSQKVQKCLETQWIRHESEWPSISQVEIESYLSDLSESGLWEAQKNASFREYQTDPEAYARDPSTCEDMLDLDSAAMGELLGENDPLQGWLDNQERITTTEKYAEHTAADERMLEEIDALDQVEDVNDPLVHHLGSHGEAAVPYLLEKLCSPRSMTSDAAGYALIEAADESIFFDLFEIWARTRQTPPYCGESLLAIYSMMRHMKAQFRNPETPAFAKDFDDLLARLVCADPGRGLEAPRRVDPDDLPDIVFSRNFSDSHFVECAGTPIEIRPSTTIQDYLLEHDEDTRVTTFRVDILDLPAPTEKLPIFEAIYGSPPLAVAFTDRGHGTSGAAFLWVKTTRGWVYLAHLYSRQA